MKKIIFFIVTISFLYPLQVQSNPTEDKKQEYTTVLPKPDFDTLNKLIAQAKAGQREIQRTLALLASSRKKRQQN